MNELENFRGRIDEIDMRIIELLAERFRLMPEIARYKSLHKIEIAQIEREKSMLSSRVELSSRLDVDEDFVRGLFNLIINQSKKIQIESQE